MYISHFNIDKVPATDDNIISYIFYTFYNNITQHDKK